MDCNFQIDIKLFLNFAYHINNAKRLFDTIYFPNSPNKNMGYFEKNMLHFGEDRDINS